MVDLPLRLQPLGGRSTTPVHFSGSRPPTSNSQSSPHLSSPANQARATAKALADPILSVPAHTYNSSQLMALARVLPVRPQSPAEEEEATTHAAASIPHTPGPLSPVTSGSATPVDAHLPDVQAEPAGAPATGFTPGLRVLVVDDDNMTRTLMKRMLTRVGCVVDVAENGRAALDALTVSPLPTPPADSGAPLVPTPFAVVFLDNQMPVMSGLDAVRAIRAAGRAAFVVGVTGNALLTDQKEFLEAGADHVLTKPVFERDLRKMLVLADAHRKASLSVS
jgi:CheY-like chemotaxis protein